MKYTKQETEQLIEGLRATAGQCNKLADELLEGLADDEKYDDGLSGEGKIGIK